jgi:hypothetical protein
LGEFWKYLRSDARLYFSGKATNLCVYRQFDIKTVTIE